MKKMDLHFVHDVMKQLILENIYRHMKDKKVTGGTQLRFREGKSCLTNPMGFYNEVTGSAGV